MVAGSAAGCLRDPAVVGEGLPAAGASADDGDGEFVCVTAPEPATVSATLHDYLDELARSTARLDVEHAEMLWAVDAQRDDDLLDALAAEAARLGVERWSLIWPEPACGGGIAAARETLAACAPQSGAATLGFGCNGWCEHASPCTGTKRCLTASACGTCIGACDLEDGAVCDGLCRGDCDAACSCTDPTDDSCAGRCDGSCTGLCELPAGGHCSGICLGFCQQELPASSMCTEEVCWGTSAAGCRSDCNGRVVAPSSSRASRACSLLVAAAGAIGTTCFPSTADPLEPCSGSSLNRLLNLNRLPSLAAELRHAQLLRDSGPALVQAWAALEDDCALNSLRPLAQDVEAALAVFELRVAESEAVVEAVRG